MKGSKKIEIVVIGSGAGGSAIAYELAKKGKRVLILEKGLVFQQGYVGNFWQVIFRYYEKYALRRSLEGAFIYGTSNVGGTTVVSCGNMVRSLEKEFYFHGIDLKKEFLEAEQELKVAPLSEKKIVAGSKIIMEASQRLSYDMRSMSKGHNSGAVCNLCGNCTVGCSSGWKWDARSYIKKALIYGATLLHPIEARQILFSNNNQVIGVKIFGRAGEEIIECNQVILAAGGINTPIILQRSGILAGHGLFIDPFEITCGIADISTQLVGSSMAAVITEFYDSDGFILSPFIDHWSQMLIFNDLWQGFLHGIFRARVFGIMVKIADSRSGRVYQNGKISKMLTKRDRYRLQQGAEISRRILIEAGVNCKTIITSNKRIRGAHPGGTAAIGEVVDNQLKVNGRDGLYVCDASVFPVAPGLPPILTIVALAKWLAKKCL